MNEHKARVKPNCIVIASFCQSMQHEKAHG